MLPTDGIDFGGSALRRDVGMVCGDGVGGVDEEDEEDAPVPFAASFAAFFAARSASRIICLISRFSWRRICACKRAALLASFLASFSSSWRVCLSSSLRISSSRLFSFFYGCFVTRDAIDVVSPESRRYPPKIDVGSSNTAFSFCQGVIRPFSVDCSLGSI